ncbi:hypothetical protein HK405_003448 [Cladochytrium tenue]|nr:hypothetical protein HK405_003448 [Cladochytrium tenue]
MALFVQPAVLRPAPGSPRTLVTVAAPMTVIAAIGAALAAATLAATATPAVAADPCAALLAAGNYWSGFNSTPAIVTGADVLSCYGSFGINASTKATQVEYLKQYFNLYPYLDIAKESTAPSFPSSVDVLAQLDTIAANATITSEFDFQTQIKAVFMSLNDAHASYFPSCFVAAEMFQPFVLDAKFSAGSPPTIYVRWSNVNRTDLYSAPIRSLMANEWASLIGDDPNTYVSYTVTKINGMDAVAYIQKVADYWTGLSHSPESRFNRAIPWILWTGSYYGFNEGIINRIRYIPSNMDWYWDYELESPSGQKVTLSKVPWVGVGSFSTTVPLASSSEYYSSFCTSNVATAALKISIPKANHADVTVNATEALLVHEEKFSAAMRRLNMATPGVKEAKLNISSPLVSDMFSAFYILDDGITGVWVLATFEALSDSATNAYYGTITAGLKMLETAGASRLIIDLSGNGGGLLCIGDALLLYLMKNPVTTVYDVRLSETFASIIKNADIILSEGFNTYVSDYGLVPHQGKSILDDPQNYTRGGATSTYSGKFQLNCSAFTDYNTTLPALDRGWAPSNITVVTDGTCGSTCAQFLRALRDQYGVRTVVTGGSTGAAFQPTSFEGGSVYQFVQIQATAQTIQQKSGAPASATADWPLHALPLPAPASLPLWESYSSAGAGGLDRPMEWVPAPADGLLDVGDVLDKALVWTAAAGVAAGGGSPTSTGGGGATTTGTKSTTSSSAVKVHPPTMVLNCLVAATLLGFWLRFE